MSNGSVDGDPWTPIVRPQYIWWENIIIVYNGIDVSLSTIH